MICKKCGNEIIEGMKFCVYCGTEVVAENDITLENKKVEESFNEVKDTIIKDTMNKNDNVQEYKSDEKSNGNIEMKQQSKKKKSKASKLLGIFSVIIFIVMILLIGFIIIKSYEMYKNYQDQEALIGIMVALLTFVLMFPLAMLCKTVSNLIANKV